MKMRNKLLILALAVCALTALLAVGVSAERILSYDPGVERVGENDSLPDWYPVNTKNFPFYHDEDAPRVVDRADLFTSDEEEELERAISELRAELDRDVVVYTDVTDYGLGKDILAADFYDFNGYGCGDEREGVCLFIDMDPDDRGGWACCTGSDTRALYTEEVANLIDDDLYYYLGEGEYYDGVSAWIGDFYRLYLKGDPFLSWLPDRGEKFERFHDGNAPRVIDFTDELTENETADLSASAEEVGGKYGIDVVVLVTNFTSSLDLKDYAEKYYEYNGYGLGGDYRGIMLCVDRSGGNDVEILTFGDGVRMTDTARDRMTDHLKDRIGSQGISAAVENWIGEADHLQKTGRVPRSFGSWLGTTVFGSILGSVAGFFGLSGAKRRMAVPRTQVNADAYVVAETLAIVAMGDRLVNTSTSRVYAPITRSSSGGSGSSGGSSYSGSYSGSSGSSHSGSGRSF